MHLLNHNVICSCVWTVLFHIYSTLGSQIYVLVFTPSILWVGKYFMLKLEQSNMGKKYYFDLSMLKPLSLKNKSTIAHFSDGISAANKSHFALDGVLVPILATDLYCLSPQLFH